MYSYECRYSITADLDMLHDRHDNLLFQILI